MMALSFRWRKCPWTASIPLSGVVLCLSQKGTFLFPVHSLVLHVHVKLHEMHMSYCTRCTCRTALHVHLKQRYTPRLHTLLYEIELYQYRRKRLMAMTNAIKLKTVQEWINLRLDERCTIGLTLSLIGLKQAFKKATSIVHRQSSNRKFIHIRSIMNNLPMC